MNIDFDIKCIRGDPQLGICDNFGGATISGITGPTGASGPAGGPTGPTGPANIIITTLSPVTGSNTTPITLVDGTRCADSLVWNNALTSWQILENPGMTSATVDGSGAGNGMYTTVAAAVADGCTKIRVIGDTTEPFIFLILPTDTVIYIDPEVTLSWGSNGFSLGAFSLTLRGSGPTSVFSYSDSPGGSTVTGGGGSVLNIFDLTVDLSASTVASNIASSLVSQINIRNSNIILPSIVGAVANFLGSGGGGITLPDCRITDTSFVGTGPFTKSFIELSSGNLTMTNIIFDGIYGGTGISSSSASFSLNGAVALTTASGLLTIDGIGLINGVYQLGSALSINISLFTFGADSAIVSNCVINNFLMSGLGSASANISNIRCVGDFSISPTNTNQQITNIQCTTVGVGVGTAGTLNANGLGNIVSNFYVTGAGTVTLASGAAGWTLIGFRTDGALTLAGLTNCTFTNLECATSLVIGGAAVGAAVTSCNLTNLTGGAAPSTVTLDRMTGCNLTDLFGGNLTIGQVGPMNNVKIQNVNMDNITLVGGPPPNQMDEVKIDQARCNNAGLAITFSNCVNCTFTNWSNDIGTGFIVTATNFPCSNCSFDNFRSPLGVFVANGPNTAPATANPMTSCSLSSINCGGSGSILGGTQCIWTDVNIGGVPIINGTQGTYMGVIFLGTGSILVDGPGNQIDGCRCLNGAGCRLLVNSVGAAAGSVGTQLKGFAQNGNAIGAHTITSPQAFIYDSFFGDVLGMVFTAAATNGSVYNTRVGVAGGVVATVTGSGGAGGLGTYVVGCRVNAAFGAGVIFGAAGSTNIVGGW